MGSFSEGECGITDDAALVTGGVAGIAQAEQARCQAALAGRQQQSIDRIGAAGLFGVDVGVELQDVPAGIAINLLRRAIGQEVREVRADHDQRFRAAPEKIEYRGDCVRSRLANRERDQRELLKDSLQEGQVHFQRVFKGVGVVAENDLRQLGNAGDGLRIEPNTAQRRGKGVDLGKRDAFNGDPMGRAKQNDAADIFCPWF